MNVLLDLLLGFPPFASNIPSRDFWCPQHYILYSFPWFPLIFSFALPSLGSIFQYYTYFIIICRGVSDFLLLKAFDCFTVPFSFFVLGFAFVLLSLRYVSFSFILCFAWQIIMKPFSLVFITPQSSISPSPHTFSFLKRALIVTWSFWLQILCVLLLKVWLGCSGSLW